MTSQEEGVAAALADADLRVRQEIAGALGLPEGQQVLDLVAKNRKDYDSQGHRIGGALVVRCTVGNGSEITVREIDIDEKNRPLSEDAITFLGAEALSREQRREVIYRRSRLY